MLPPLLRPAVATRTSHRSCHARLRYASARQSSLSIGRRNALEGSKRCPHDARNRAHPADGTKDNECAIGNRSLRHQQSNGHHDYYRQLDLMKAWRHHSGTAACQKAAVHMLCRLISFSPIAIGDASGARVEEDRTPPRTRNCGRCAGRDKPASFLRKRSAGWLAGTARCRCSGAQVH